MTNSVIFDVRQTAGLYQVLNFSFPFIFMFLFIFFIQIFKFKSRYKQPEDQNDNNSKRVIVGILCFFGFLFSYVFYDYFSLSKSLDDQKCQVVKGVITDYIPTGKGHKHESFKVGDVVFYHSNDLSAGFLGKNHFADLSAFMEGRPKVRVYYLDSSLGREIARLEVIK